MMKRYLLVPTAVAFSRFCSATACIHAELAHRESHHSHETGSGFYTDGGSLNLGIRRQEHAGDGEPVTAVGSTVGSFAGSVDISAGGAYTQTGGERRAVGEDIDVSAQRIEVDAEMDRAAGGSESHAKQSGLSWSLSSPVITAAETVDQMIEAREDRGPSPRCVGRHHRRLGRSKRRLSRRRPTEPYHEDETVVGSTLTSEPGGCILRVKVSF